MPMNFGALTPLVCPDGETIWVKSHFTSGDKADIKGKSVSGTKMKLTASMEQRAKRLKDAIEHDEQINPDDDITLAEIDYEAMLNRAEYAALEVAIKRWTYRYPAEIEDENGNMIPHPSAGQLVPVSLSSIRDLDDETINFVKVELNRMNPEFTADTKDASSMSVSQPSEARVEAASPTR